MNNRSPKTEIPQGAIFVSVQADADSPLHEDEALVYLARAVERGGAQGLRIDSPETVKKVAAATDLPILGINKIGDRSGVFITPTFAAAKAVVDAGASVVAMDGTNRPRANNEDLAEIVARIHEELNVPVMADIDNLENGIYAAHCGVDYVGTTLSGYTAGTVPTGPDLQLIRDLVGAIDTPVVAEGRLHTPQDAKAAFVAGAHAVVIGQAITSPEAILRRFRAAVA